MKYPKLNLNIVLVEPEIPANTGNIGRTCVGTWSKLHLVGKLGFEINDTRLKRAGLDYWPELDWVHHPTFEQWWDSVPDKSRVFFFTTKSKKPFYNIDFQPGDYLVFGKETKGLDESILKSYPEQTVTVPFPGRVRSFNLSNTVAMALSEGVRQFIKSGHLELDI